MRGQQVGVKPQTQLHGNSVLESFFGHKEIYRSHTNMFAAVLLEQLYVCL